MLITDNYSDFQYVDVPLPEVLQKLLPDWDPVDFVAMNKSTYDGIVADFITDLQDRQSRLSPAKRKKRSVQSVQSPINNNAEHKR